MRITYLFITITFLISCKTLENTSVKTIEVDPDYFLQDNLLSEIVIEKYEIGGVESDCYVIKSRSIPVEHQMGPWCPKTIEDGKDEGGLWFKDGKVYDVNGEFVTNLDEFYNDPKWKLYKEDGTIKYTNSKEACLGAAKPNVEEAYKNHCVECLPSYFENQSTTFIVPVKPVYNQQTQRLRRGALGVALNGVKMDPPAPIHAILAAYTIAPLDDHGGHVNPHGGYHYHAATGSTKEIEQLDNHAPLIGYAIDGFGIYAQLNKSDEVSEDLDECGGHIDELRGYHYHANNPGKNQIISCLRGNPGIAKVKE